MFELQVKDGLIWHTLDAFESLPAAVRIARDLYDGKEELCVRDTKSGCIRWTTNGLQW